MIRLLEVSREGLDNNLAVGGVLMDLSKSLDCIPHDLLIAKLKVYGFDDHSVYYFYSYLDNTKQCVRINNEKSSLQDIISGVSEGSVVGSTLFNLFFNNFLLFILIASVQNFADDNSLSNITKTIDSLKQTLESECKLAIKWFHENKMIVDPDKFQVIVLHKRKSSNTEVKIYHWFRANSSGDKLNFSLHFDKICLKPANQLNSLVRIKRSSGNEERKVSINSFAFQISIIVLWFGY